MYLLVHESILKEDLRQCKKNIAYRLDLLHTPNMADKADLKKVNFRVPEPLWDRIKALAQKRGMKVQVLSANLLAAGLKAELTK
jgi:predicted DNA binding CopG/RHH family protein